MLVLLSVNLNGDWIKEGLSEKSDDPFTQGENRAISFQDKQFMHKPKSKAN